MIKSEMFTTLAATFLEGNKDEWFYKSFIVFKSYSLTISTKNIWKYIITITK